MTEKDKLHTGDLYFPGDPEIEKEQRIYQDMLMEYNQIPHSRQAERDAMLKKMFAPAFPESLQALPPSVRKYMLRC